MSPTVSCLFLNIILQRSMLILEVWALEEAQLSCFRAAWGRFLGECCSWCHLIGSLCFLSAMRWDPVLSLLLLPLCSTWVHGDRDLYTEPSQRWTKANASSLMLVISCIFLIVTVLTNMQKHQNTRCFKFPLTYFIWDSEVSQRNYLPKHKNESYLKFILLDVSYDLKRALGP